MIGTSVRQDDAMDAVMADLVQSQNVARKRLKFDPAAGRPRSTGQTIARNLMLAQECGNMPLVEGRFLPGSCANLCQRRRPQACLGGSLACFVPTARSLACLMLLVPIGGGGGGGII
jgi:hypothetical protein